MVPIPTALLIGLFAAPAAASVEGPAALQVSGARVKGYFHVPSEDPKHHVIFKYGDLINRARLFKQAHPEYNVTVDFCIYKIERDVWIAFDRSYSRYGEISTESFGGDSADKLIYIVVQAARAGVDVRMIYHNPVNPTPDEIAEYVLDLRQGDTALQTHLQLHRAYWQSGATNGQMHNKFVLVNNYAGSSVDYNDTVYVATANIDWKTYRSQSGVMVNGHRDLFNAYTRFFNILWNSTYNVLEDGFVQPSEPEKTDSRRGMWARVREAHSMGSLNYESDDVSAYFFPLPTTHCGTAGSPRDAWDVDFNPVAARTNDLQNSVAGMRSVKIDMYHWKYDTFGERLVEELRGAPTPRSIEAVVNVDSRAGLVGAFTGVGDLEFGAQTHAKNFLYAFTGVAAPEYFTITGSTNAKWDAYCSKSNNQLQIREAAAAHSVYDWHKTTQEFFLPADSAAVVSPFYFLIPLLAMHGG